MGAESLITSWLVYLPDPSAVGAVRAYGSAAEVPQRIGTTEGTVVVP
jgi:hypothetical protein